MAELPRNVYRHRNGYRGQRQVDGEMHRTETMPTPELAAAALEQLVADTTEPSDVLEELERVGGQLDAARQAVRRATLAEQRRRRKRKRGQG